jgi:hypothetical protein
MDTATQNAQIDWVRNSEGHIYGDGTADLAAALTAITDTMTAKQAAERAHEIVREFSANFGQNPDIETFLRTPEQNAGYAHGNCYVVSWESGPYQWAIAASMSMNKFCEPYYSFDLCFYPSEDR